MSAADVAEQVARLGIVLDTDRLDQHLLVDDAVVEALAAAAETGPDDVIVDAGSGPGTIAAALAARARLVRAVEVDARFAPLLADVARRCPSVRVEVANVLDADLAGVDVIVGNIPFTVIEPLLAAAVTSAVGRLVLITGASVAGAAEAPYDSAEFSRTSLYIQAVFEFELLDRIPPQAFSPPPRKAAVLVRLTRKRSSSGLRLLAAAFARRPQTRVRDAVARLGLDVKNLPVRGQARLQALTNADVGALADFVVQSSTTKGEAR